MKYENTRGEIRHKIEVDVVITDAQSGIQVRERTKDLNCYGCGVNTVVPFPRGAVVLLKIGYEHEKIAVLGKVIYRREDIGTGIVFTAIEPKDLELLEKWIAK